MFSSRLMFTSNRIFTFIKNHRTLFEVLLIGLLALSLRLINLEQWPRWYVDEGTYGSSGKNLLNGIWGYVTWGPNFGPPLYCPLLTSVLVKFLGNTYFAIRLPSAILGSISCVLVYFIGKKLYNRFVGISASVIFLIASVTLNRLALYDNLMVFFFILGVFLYLKFREDGKDRWLYLIGICAGLGFLSKFTGVVILVFVIFQSLIDGKFFKAWKIIPVFILIALIYPLIGWLIDWNAFLHDTLEFGGRLSYLDHILYMVTMNQYHSQLESSSFGYEIWSTLGFILIFYLLARNHDGDKLSCIWAGSVLCIYFLYGTGWWIFLLALYPVYSFAIGVALHDIVYGRNNYPLLAVFIMLFMLPIFTYQHLYPAAYSQYGKYLFFAVFLIAFIIMIARSRGFDLPSGMITEIRKSFQNNRACVYRAFLLVPIIVIMSAASIYQLKPVFTTDDSADQRAVVDWLNANTKKGDLVGAANPIIYPLKNATGIPLEDVVYMTTRQDFLAYTAALLPRYKLDCSLWKMDYFVVDITLRGMGLGSFLGETAGADWAKVFAAGDYTVYKNPGYTTPPTWMSGGLNNGATSDSKVSILDGGLKIALASTITGVRSSGTILSAIAYELPIDITITHNLPALDTQNYHSYNIALMGNISQYFIIHQIGPPGFIEAGVQDADQWMPIWHEFLQPPTGVIKWRITLDSQYFTFFENGEMLCQIPNTLPQKQFLLSFSHDTRDTTLKTWEIQKITSTKDVQP